MDKYQIKDDKVQEAIDVIANYFKKSTKDNADVFAYDFLSDLDTRLTGKYEKIGNIIFERFRSY